MWKSRSELLNTLMRKKRCIGRLHNAATAQNLLPLYGTNSTPSTPKSLLFVSSREERLECLFDEDAACVRSLLFNGHEITSGISFLARDENWGTLATHDVVVRSREKSENFWSLEWEATVGDNALQLQGFLTGRQQTIDNQKEELHVSVSVQATALRDLKTCRTGFVILHPQVGQTSRQASDDMVICNARAQHTGFKLRMSAFCTTYRWRRCFIDQVSGLGAATAAIYKYKIIIVPSRKLPL